MTHPEVVRAVIRFVHEAGVRCQSFPHGAITGGKVWAFKLNPVGKLAALSIGTLMPYHLLFVPMNPTAVNNDAPPVRHSIPASLTRA